MEKLSRDDEREGLRAAKSVLNRKAYLLFRAALLDGIKLRSASVPARAAAEPPAVAEETPPPSSTEGIETTDEAC